MEINFSQLKESSIQFDQKLRLPINTLTINIDNQWKYFSNFISDIIETEAGYKFKTKINEILIDTGNEVDYIIMSAYYLKIFREKIKNITVEKKIIEDFRGNKKITEVSAKKFEFKLFNAIFNSKIGFTYQTNVNALDIINIGINSIGQFLNIFFPANNQNYYYCYNV